MTNQIAESMTTRTQGLSSVILTQAHTTYRELMSTQLGCSDIVYLKAGDTRALSCLTELIIDPLNDLLVLDWTGGPREFLKDRQRVSSHQLPHNSCSLGRKRGRGNARER